MEKIEKFINIIKENSVEIPEEVRDFIYDLTPSDVGREVFDGGWVVNFEGFTDDCNSDAEERCRLPSEDPRHLSSYDQVFDEVYNEWIEKEGTPPIEQGMAGDEYNPILYSIFYKGK